MDILFQIEFIIALVTFLSIVSMNVAKKNTTLVHTYLIQSLMLVSLLSLETYSEMSLEIGIVTLVMFVIKVIIVPQVLLRILKQHKASVSASTYLNVPMTLGSLILLCVFAQSYVFSEFFTTTPILRIFLIGSMLMSFFLTINRKGAISQIIGILSLENCIFAFGFFLHLKQAAALEIGMIFDVFFWIIISTIFVRMLIKHFGSIDVTQLRELKK
ncbi:MAG: hypothetical protein Q7T54_03580 [Candidatus Levybacteria bacterium]|nr:hypothetical protein [Candidatus Levybacteria bacterium]